ncbi:F-box protein PP2-A15 [Camellia lanceoleosa]|nr:F-box protein PP2-A15 [Camellia lanceoleosa]
MACVFLYLTLAEICNLTQVNCAFRGASSSDSVWESKFPSNYHDILDLMPLERHQNLTKKDIFAFLSRLFLWTMATRHVLLSFEFKLKNWNYFWVF